MKPVAPVAASEINATPYGVFAPGPKGRELALRPSKGERHIESRRPRMVAEEVAEKHTDVEVLRVNVAEVDGAG